MSEELVEAVARAICCHTGCVNRHSGSQYAICQAHTFKKDARAALAVARPAILEECISKAWDLAEADGSFVDVVALERILFPKSIDVGGEG